MRVDRPPAIRACDVGLLRAQKHDFTDARLTLKMVDDLVTVESFHAGLFGGTVSAKDTSLRLGPAQRPFDATLQAENIQLSKAMAAYSDKKVCGCLLRIRSYRAL